MMNTATNRKAYWFYRDYINSTIHSVLNAYITTPSSRKIEAEKDIIREMIDNGGSGYRVTAASAYTFTCGYMLNENTLIIHTRDNRFIINVNGVYNG